MSKYKCSICDYSSSKNDVERHIDRKIKCGPNPELIILAIEIKCDKCDKEYSSIKTLTAHTKICTFNNNTKKYKEQYEKYKEQYDNLKDQYDNLKEQTDYIIKEKIKDKYEKIKGQHEKMKEQYEKHKEQNNS